MSLTANAEIEIKKRTAITARFFIMHYALCIIFQTSTNPILLLHLPFGM